MYYVAVFCPHHSTTTTTIETLDGGFNSSMYLLFYRYEKQTSSQKEKSLCNNANSMLIFSKTLILINKYSCCNKSSWQDVSTFVYFVVLFQCCDGAYKL